MKGSRDTTAHQATEPRSTRRPTTPAAADRAGREIGRHRRSRYPRRQLRAILPPDLGIAMDQLSRWRQFHAGGCCHRRHLRTGGRSADLASSITTPLLSAPRFLKAVDSSDLGPCCTGLLSVSSTREPAPRRRCADNRRLLKSTAKIVAPAASRRPSIAQFTSTEIIRLQRAMTDAPWARRLIWFCRNGLVVALG